jgi:hypothetical protein
MKKRKNKVKIFDLIVRFSFMCITAIFMIAFSLKMMN